jgi:hypothetical protein
VLAGFELGTDAKIYHHPDRYSDPRGKEMWRRVMGLIGEPAEPPPGLMSHRRAVGVT